MFSAAESDYSFSLTTFSPTGKLVQIEYALNAVAEGNTCVGIKARDGVVLCAEKKVVSPLVDENTVERVSNLSDHVGVTYAGLGPDSRVLLRKGRKECEVYNRLYHDKVPTGQISRFLGGVMQEFTQSGGVRPFGCSLLVAGLDHTGPRLYQVDPSGSYWGWRAVALGRNMAQAKAFLEKRYRPDMGIDDAIHTAIMTIKENFDGELTESKIEVGVIKIDAEGNTTPFRKLPNDEIREALSTLE
eukprot:gnl/Trimastix_PCT/814.p1 GENE.gnl/Trimastix_PCT/814~~gnl/Trimastix_PCT/814.p1  ORF type:complete len:244 (-),score=46.35 gnl/Trimastix_PCT/814:28-759(-)